MTNTTAHRVFTEESFAVFTKELSARIMELERAECAEAVEGLKDPGEPDSGDWNSACRIAAARIRGRARIIERPKDDEIKNMWQQRRANSNDR